MNTRELQKAFQPFVQTERAVLRERIESYTRGIKSYAEDIEEYRERMADFKRYIEERQRDIASRKRTIKESREALRTMPVDRERIKREWSRIKKHPMVYSATIENETVIIITYPLFTGIRKTPKSKAKKRTCIGSFRIYIPLSIGSGSNIETRNLSFNGRSHWGTSSGDDKPCLGSWLPQLNEARKAGNWFLLLTTLQSFLLSTEDAAAYVPSDHWKRERALGEAMNRRYAAHNSTIYHYNGEFWHVHGETVRAAVPEEAEDMPQFLVDKLLNEGHEVVTPLLPRYSRRNALARVDSVTDARAREMVEAFTKPLTREVIETL